MALFRRSRPDDPDLAALVGRRRVLASGSSAEGPVLGLADALVHPGAGGWHEVAWHEIEHGGWDHASRTLRWNRTDGGTGSVVLTDTGHLPDLFNERVTASIACVRTVDLDGTKQAVITARRDLGNPDGPLVWRVAPGKGVQREQVDADPRVALELARLRAEYA